MQILCSRLAQGMQAEVALLQRGYCRKFADLLVALHAKRCSSLNETVHKCGGFIARPIIVVGTKNRSCSRRTLY